MNADEPRKERIWLAAGGLIGVIVAGVVIVTLVVLQGGDAGEVRGPAAPPSTTAAVASNVAESLAKARDEALRTAEEAVITLHTMDSKSAPDSINRWEAVATSPLLELLRTKHAENVALYSGSKTSTSAKVLASAVARMTGDGSTADVLLHVEVTTTDAAGTRVQQSREKASMIQTANGWKVSVHLPIQPPA